MNKNCKAKISLGLKRYQLLHPEAKIKLSNLLKGKHNSPVTEFKKGEIYSPFAGKHLPEEIKKKISLKLKGRFSGQNNPFFGKHHTNNTKMKISLKKKGRKVGPFTEEHKKKISTALKIYLSKNQDVLRQRLENIKKFNFKKGHILSLCKTDREKLITSILKGLLKRPTSYEQKVITLINKYNLPYRYVGDGQVIISYKNPDFINTNNQKILIEVYHNFWHPNGYEQQRTKRFAKYGYKTIFLNDDDLERENWEQICLNKITHQAGI